LPIKTPRKPASDETVIETYPPEEAQPNRQVSLPLEIKEQEQEKEQAAKTIQLYISHFFLYNSATSNYSFREYNSFSNALELGGRIQLSQAIGAEARYNVSLGADIDGDTLNHSKSFTKFNEFKSGVFFHLDSGSEAEFKINSVEFKLLFIDKRMILPPDDLNRMSLKSTGFGIGVKTPLDLKHPSFWSLDISFYPNLQHAEEKMGIAVSSGNHKQSSLTEVGLNHILFQNARNELYLRTELQVEKNYFDGPAQLLDPKSNATPSNVSITNSTLKLSLGFSWGK